MGLVEYVKAWATYPTTSEYPQGLVYTVVESVAVGGIVYGVGYYFTRDLVMSLPLGMGSTALYMGARGLQKAFSLGSTNNTIDQTLEE